MSGATCEVWTRDPRGFFLQEYRPKGQFGRTLILLGDLPDPLLIGYTHYQGSTDIIAPEIVGEDGDRWDTGWDALKRCNHPESSWTQAWAYSWYGGGDHWPVAVCLSCRVAHGNYCAYGPDVDGWSQSEETQRRQREWRDAGWPRKGPPPGVIDIDDREGDDA